eukprot:1202076-Lingulodinium_polyedra.AAC.1
MAKLKPEAAAWCSERAGFWDTAVAGSSALQAALRRSLGADVARLLGDEASVALWDGEKFYDSLDLLDIVRAAEKQEYPADVLCLALQAHSGPRVLRAGGTYSE